MATSKRKPAKPDWLVIKAEYVAGAEPAELAAKHGVPSGTLRSKASRDKWAEEREQFAAKVQQAITESAALAAAEAIGRGAIMSAQEVLEELSRIGRGGMRKVATWGASGVILRESSDLDDADACLVSEVSESHTAMGGGSLKLKLYDKLAALDKLARFHRLYGDDRADDSAPSDQPGGVVEIPALDPAPLPPADGEG